MAGHIADSGSVSWCTPPMIVDRVCETFGGVIELDPCSNPGSIVGAEQEYRLPDKDGLVESWNAKSIYVNPPFGTTYVSADRVAYSAKEFKELPEDIKAGCKKSVIFDWIRKCVIAGINGSSVILLCPAAVDTRHWQKLIFPFASRICWLSGRVKFIGAESCAPMAIAISLFSGDHQVIDRFGQVFSDVGAIRTNSPPSEGVVGTEVSNGRE